MICLERRGKFPVIYGAERELDVFHILFICHVVLEKRSCEPANKYASPALINSTC